MNIGHQLKKAREAKKLSQQDVADILDITQKTLSNIESEKSKPTIEQLAKMSSIYEIDIIDILSKQGIVFNQEQQRGEIGGIVNHFHYPEKLLEQYEARLKDKEELIASLKNEISLLKNRIL